MVDCLCCSSRNCQIFLLQVAFRKRKRSAFLGDELLRILTDKLPLSIYGMLENVVTPQHPSVEVPLPFFVFLT